MRLIRCPLQRSPCTNTETIVAVKPYGTERAVRQIEDKVAPPPSAEVQV